MLRIQLKTLAQVCTGQGNLERELGFHELLIGFVLLIVHGVVHQVVHVLLDSRYINTAVVAVDSYDRWQIGGNADLALHSQPKRQ